MPREPVFNEKGIFGFPERFLAILSEKKLFIEYMEKRARLLQVLTVKAI